jgi:hypothetical protein
MFARELHRCHILESGSETLDRIKASVKNSPSVQIKPFTVRPETAAALFDAPHLLQDMVKAGWVKPCYRTHRCTLYLVTDLEKCAERLAKGERPIIETV